MKFVSEFLLVLLSICIIEFFNFSRIILKLERFECHRDSLFTTNYLIELFYESVKMFNL